MNQQSFKKALEIPLNNCEIYVQDNANPLQKIK